MTEISNGYKAIVMGASAGGLFAFSAILSNLPNNYPLPIIIVQHRIKSEKSLLEEILQSKCKMQVKQADEKEMIKKSIIYIAPPDYHLLVEQNRTFSLSSDEHVKSSRPSIDVLFESAAAVYGTELIGIILTGASNDGCEGIKTIKRMGGLTIAQNPDEAEFPVMPKASINTKCIQQIHSLNEIKELLLKIT